MFLKTLCIFFIQLLTSHPTLVNSHPYSYLSLYLLAVDGMHLAAAAAAAAAAVVVAVAAVVVAAVD